ncbi:tryptophan 7-halogenase [Stigmatella sp. ncwal1]|uniref:Tryptophan 7-halogenase n=1 Tax=Stigmatella ashevillensis TaxID=2995309 RepID=A0ABT5DDZ4_9BACT|nr:FAD-dependent oxidoreductase [Stigmatella ashevillena]MDC0711899.1 tryptophan 7-halogenase [Stigmatella ashevillena]
MSGEVARAHAPWDVVIVGAGPAGCAAGIGCAEAGLKVLIVEAARFPRALPGETLHPGVEPLLERLGVAGAVWGAGFLRHEGVWTHAPEGRVFTPYGSDGNGPWRGFQAWRATFDELLLRRARSLGAEVWQPCRALRPLVAHGRVVGLETSMGPLNSRFVVDASGGGRWLVRKHGVSRHVGSPPLLARYGYVHGEFGEALEQPMLRLEPGGWEWMARVRPGHWAWARLSLDPSRRTSAQPPRALATGRELGPSRGAEVTWSWVGDCAGEGYFIAGDAAVVLDPASSQGVLRALMQGMMVAHLITPCVLGTSDEPEAACAYRRWVKDLYHRSASELRARYASRASSGVE